MKLGKTKLKRMLSEETGIPPQDIADFGKYEYYGNKEQLSVGGHTLTAANGVIKLHSPFVCDDRVVYRSCEIKRAPTNEAATSGRTGNYFILTQGGKDVHRYRTGIQKTSS